MQEALNFRQKRMNRLVSNRVRPAFVTSHLPPTNSKLREFQPQSLTAHGKRMYEIPNAGGSSILSEIMSYELFHKTFDAELLDTEMEISYFPKGGAMTDYTCTLLGRKIGVSVTRAFAWNRDFNQEDADRLLGKKLTGCIYATKNCMTKVQRQILHVWASSNTAVQYLKNSFQKLETKVKANTIVFVTAAPDVDWLFNNNKQKSRAHSEAHKKRMGKKKKKKGATTSQKKNKPKSKTRNSNQRSNNNNNSNKNSNSTQTDHRSHRKSNNRKIDKFGGFGKGELSIYESDKAFTEEIYPIFDSDSFYYNTNMFSDVLYSKYDSFLYCDYKSCLNLHTDDEIQTMYRFPNDRILKSEYLKLKCTEQIVPMERIYLWKEVFRIKFPHETDNQFHG
eukprot:Awhi_evm1s15540